MPAELLPSEWWVEWAVHESQVAEDAWDEIQVETLRKAEEWFRKFKADPSVIAVRIIRKDAEIWESLERTPTTPST